MVLPLILLGLCIGSFLNVVIYRVPLGQSIISPPSHCTLCKGRIKSRDLIPVISWIALKGKCRLCGAHISIKYMAVELLTAMVYLWAYAVVGLSMHIIPLLILATVLIAVSFIDWENGIIPFSILICAVIPALCFALAGIGVPIIDALFGALVGGGFIFAVDIFSRVIFKRPGMGGGDVALMLTAGLFLGMQRTVLALFLAVIMGGVYASVLLATKRAEKYGTFPFGPFLAIGSWVALLHGERFIEWYIYRI